MEEGIKFSKKNLNHGLDTKNSRVFNSTSFNDIGFVVQITPET